MNLTMTLEGLHFRCVTRFTVLPVARLLHSSPLLMVFGLMVLYTASNHGALGQECGSPPTVRNSVQTFYNETVGNQTVNYVSYYCKSGYKVSGPGFIKASCNGSYQWDLDEESSPWKDCSESALSEGCREIHIHNLTQVDINLMTTPSDNFDQCVLTCRQGNYLFFARQGSNCYCFPSLIQIDPPTFSSGDCNDYCHDNMSYCGSAPDKYSVYTTFHSTVVIDNIDEISAPIKPMYTELNCIQYCKGKAFLLAYYLEEQLKCHCFYRIPSYTAIFNTFQETNMTGSLISTEVSSLPVTSCKSLFSMGMFYHGHYILEDGRNISCVFYDDSTNCDSGWVAYQQGCYHLEKTQENSTWHYENCKSYDSLLVSIGDAAEMNFIHTATRAMTHIDKTTGFYIGLYDTTSLFSYMWADETQLSFRPFQNGFPNNISNTCIKKHLEAGVISNVHCSDITLTAICEKRSSTPGCARPLSGSLNQPVLTSDTMLTSLCFETCRSHDLALSITSGPNCHCYDDDISPFQLVSWDQCDVPCSIHPFQMCGGTNATVFITQDQGQPYRETCDLMILEGMVTNITLQNATGISNVDCQDRAGETCPMSWLDIGGRCYRFFPEYNAQSTLTCISMGGYLSVFETDEEKALVIETLRKIPSLVGSYVTWAMGLYFHRPYSSRARHTNGAWVTPSLQSYAPNATSDCSVFQFPSGAQLPEGGACGENPFICEQASDYLGCYNVSETDKASPVISGYPDMTVRLCMEACKPTGKPFAGLFGTQNCLCVDYLGVLANTECTELCASKQSCGTYSTDHMSVYLIDYGFNASSCSDLFKQGVLLNGNYTLGDGQNTWCGMKNSTFLADYAEESAIEGTNDYTNHRFGEGDVVLSLDITPSFNDTVDARLACQDIYDPASIIATITSATVQSLLMEVLQWSLDVGVSVPALVGAVDPFGMGSYMWSNGDLFRPSEYSMSEDIFQYSVYWSGYLVMDYQGTLNIRNMETTYHRSCERDKTYKACYKALNLTTIATTAPVKDYNSVNTALCRQVCQNVNATHFLMSTQSCLCYDAMDASGGVLNHMEEVPSNETDCNVGCQAHPFQFCGNPPYFRLHEIVARDEAKTCGELYDNFVVYNATYVVNGNQTQCGLDDSSLSCPPGFISKDNRCYAFERREDLTPLYAASECFSRSAYLASPTTEIEIESMVHLIGEISQLRGAELWHIGYSVPFQTGYWTSSLGYMLNQNHPLASSLGKDDLKCVALNVTSKTLISVSCDDKLPFICESNSPYLGCAQIDPMNVTSSLELPTVMSLQICVSFCYGHVLDLPIAAVHDTTCHCLTSKDEIPNLSNEGCVPQEQCTSQSNQMCGDAPNVLTDPVFSVYDIAAMPEELLTHTCDDLFSFGVYIPALYHTKYDNDDGFESIRCFKYSSQSNYILSYSTSAVIQTSTPEAGYLADDVPIQVYAFKGWMGQVVSDPFIYIDLNEFYVLQGLILIDPEPGTNKQVLGMTVSLDGTYETKLETITLPPSRTVTWHYLSVPMVLRHFRLFFNETDKPRLSLELVGYLYTQHNFHYSYEGCHKPVNMTSSVTSFNAAGIDVCRQSCDGQGYPLATVYHPDICECGQADDMRDLYEVGHCNMTCWTLPCDSQGGDNITKAVYSTIDFVCPPFRVNDSTTTETVVMPGYLDDVTVATSVQVDCIAGYEFNASSNNMASLKTMCRNNKIWHPDVTGLVCVKIECDAPPIHSEANITFTNGTKYEDVAIYSCGSNPGIIFDGLHDTWTIKCGPAKEWVPSYVPPCSRRICQTPPPITLATVDALGKTTLVFEDIVTYRCDEGTRFSISNTTEVNSTCLDSGQWTALGEFCTRFMCPARPAPVLSAMYSQNGTSGLYKCIFDHTFSDRTDSQAVYCNNDTGMVWTKPTSNCSQSTSRDSPWTLYSSAYRLTAPPVTTKAVRSITGCALACLSDSKCLKFSFIDVDSSTNCVASLNSDANITFSRDGQADNGWSTYYMGGPT